MMRTYEKDDRPVISTKSTSPNFQARPFAPPQSDVSQVNQTTEGQSIQVKSLLPENLLGKGIFTPKTESSGRPVQRDVLFSRRTPVQAKLNIGEPDDKYEKEADTIAAKVVQQINSSPQENSAQTQEGKENSLQLQRSPKISKLQRQASVEEEEEDLQRSPLIQRREKIGGGEASEGLESSIQSAQGGGQSLDSNLQVKMGQAMGADFSRVKVHTDARSDQLNKSIQAKAFTTGQDVFFRQGAYQPSSRGGQELIAHELTHVVQQNNRVTPRMFLAQQHPVALTSSQSCIQREYFPDPKTFNKAQLYRLRARFEQAALEVAQEINKNGHSGNLDQVCKELVKRLMISDVDLGDRSHLKDASLIENGKNISKKKKKDVFTAEYPNELAKLISSASDKKQYSVIRENIKNRYIRGLNQGGWKKINKEMTFGSEETYTSTITPVNQEFNETFAGYGETGSSSMSPRLTDDPDKQNEMRATNLWLTQYKTEALGSPTGKLIFESFRSGSLAYSLDDVSHAKRKEISQSKTEEVLKAMALHTLITKTPAQQRERILTKDGLLEISVISQSLQTPTGAKVLGAEEQQVRDQIAALKEYGEKPQELKIQWNGESKTIVVKFDIIAFNFGVNSAKTLSKGALGAEGEQQNINKEAMPKLSTAYNKFLELMVIAILTKTKEMELNKGNISQAEHDNIIQSIRDARESQDKAKLLMQQIQKRWESGGTAYEVPALIANLAFTMGHLAHFNCKSGKDRTGLMDAESKYLAQQIHEKTSVGSVKVPEYENELKGQKLDDYQQILMESGNLEVQETNTGGKGYKVVPVEILEQDLAKRLGEFLPLVQGLKEFTDVEQKYQPSNKQRLKGFG